MSQEESSVDVPDGWVREELWAGMDTIGWDEFVGMSGGFKCDICGHYIPLEAIDGDTCPACDRDGMIGTVITGKQQVVSMHPEGWFDE